MVPGSLYSTIWTTQCGGGLAFLRWARPMIFARAADLKRTGLKTRHYRAGSRSRVRSSGLGAIACLLIATCRKFTVLLANARSEEHTSELQSLTNLVCRLLLEK